MKYQHLSCLYSCIHIYIIAESWPAPLVLSPTLLILSTHRHKESKVLSLTVSLYTLLVFIPHLLRNVSLPQGHSYLFCLEPSNEHSLLLSGLGGWFIPRLSLTSFKVWVRVSCFQPGHPVRQTLLPKSIFFFNYLISFVEIQLTTWVKAYFLNSLVSHSSIPSVYTPIAAWLWPLPAEFQLRQNNSAKIKINILHTPIYILESAYLLGKFFCGLKWNVFGLLVTLRILDWGAWEDCSVNKHLFCKCKDLSSNPQHPHNDLYSCSYLQPQHWEVETGRTWEFAGWAALPKQRASGCADILFVL